MNSQSAQSVRKFEDNQKALMTSTVSMKVTSKIIAEIRNLKRWLFKHQYDSIPNGEQGRLWNVVRTYATMNTIDTTTTSGNSCGNLAYDLLEDYLKMPEGKLCNGKHKQAGLKLMSQLSSNNNNRSSNSSDRNREMASESDSRRVKVKWIISDIEKNLAGSRIGSDTYSGTLISLDGQNFIENVIIPSDIAVSYQNIVKDNQSNFEEIEVWVIYRAGKETSDDLNANDVVVECLVNENN